MPPGPRKCSAADSKLVADYIFNAFYSPLAQARSRPARVALSRLTVRQYRNSVYDLVASFRPPAPRDDKQGLRGEYYKSSRYRQTDRTTERIDPEIHFDYGIAGPTPEQSDPYQFAMRWQGSVLAPDTGEYEFIVKSENAVQLWINDPKLPLIDGLVKSGTDNEYRATLYLLGGRLYPLRLEFSKGVQGVDNIEVVKKKPPARSFLTLEWRRPKLAQEVIPQRYLRPVSGPESYVPSTPFPPDDRSLGYERGTSVSKAWDEATTAGALDAAAYIAKHLRDLAGANEGSPDFKAKAESFCRLFAERALRRPLTEEQQRFYVTRRFEGAPDVLTAVKRVVILALKSPGFLYEDAGNAKPDGYDVAARLALGLWDSLPDAELLKAATSGELSTREQAQRQAERMAADPRAWFKLRDFLLQWLKVDQVPEIAKDVKRYPGFDSAVATDLRSSLEIFLEKTAWSNESDYRQLLLGDEVYLNGRLAKLYSIDLPETATFQAVELNKGERFGVLSQPYVLSTFAYLDSSSPIHRGVLIARNLLGRTLQAPPVAVAPVAAELHPNLTTRQRVAIQTQPAACNTCHGLINPLGFALEKFDAVGRLRDRENGKPVDDSGSYLTRSGKTVKFDGARGLANFLATSSEAQSAFVEKLFHAVVKQPVLAYGPTALPTLQQSFESKQFSIRKLMVSSVALAAIQR
jgi:hypothetical protein